MSPAAAAGSTDPPAPRRRHRGLGPRHQDITPRRSPPAPPHDHAKPAAPAGSWSTLGRVGSISYVDGRARVVPDESPCRTVRRPGDGACDVTSAPTAQDTTSPADAERDPGARLGLKPDTTIGSGRVDGGWWPRSADLTAELPGLFSALTPRIGRIERVAYNLDDWGPAPRKIRFDGATVRLGGYHLLRSATVELLTARQTVTLLVVPPDTPPPAAQDALAAAASADDGEGAEALPASPNGPTERSSVRRRRTRGDRSNRRSE